MIDIELLSEILDEQIDSIKIEDNEIVYAFRVSSYGMTPHGYAHDEGSINVYELAFGKCIAWAINKGFIIELGVYPVNKINKDDRDYFYTIKGLDCNLLITSEEYDVIKTEYDCIFKACELIREIIKTNYKL